MEIVAGGEETQPTAAKEQPRTKRKAKESQSADDMSVAEAATDKAAAQPKGDKPSVLQQIRQEANEGDEAPTGTLTLRQIVGGDFLVTLLRGQIWLIVLIVLFITGYVAVRYQCQQDIIRIAQLEKELKDAKFKALSSKSNLTILCRQSNIIEGLKANQDSLIKSNLQPPYRVIVKSE